jgi:hypothetical protein
MYCCPPLGNERLVCQLSTTAFEGTKAEAIVGAGIVIGSEIVGVGGHVHVHVACTGQLHVQPVVVEGGVVKPMLVVVVDVA